MSVPGDTSHRIATMEHLVATVRNTRHRITMMGHLVCNGANDTNSWENLLAMGSNDDR
jgi:hypothetical protein